MTTPTNTPSKGSSVAERVLEKFDLVRRDAEQEYARLRKDALTYFEADDVESLAYVSKRLVTINHAMKYLDGMRTMYLDSGVEGLARYAFHASPSFRGLSSEGFDYAMKCARDII